MAKDEVTFSRNLSVGFNDRGMGRGDFAVVQKVGDETRLVARLVDIGIQEPGKRPLTVEDINPVRENAALFAAAPELYDACVDALREMRGFREGGSRAFSEEIERLEKAIAKATPR